MSALITVSVSLLVYSGDQHIARMTFDQGCDLAVLAAEQKITLPVTRYGTILDLCRSLADRDGIFYPATICRFLRVMS